jgi:hypothetical protein
VLEHYSNYKNKALAAGPINTPDGVKWSDSRYGFFILCDSHLEKKKIEECVWNLFTDS